MERAIYRGFVDTDVQSTIPMKLDVVKIENDLAELVRRALLRRRRVCAGKKGQAALRTKKQENLE